MDEDARKLEKLESDLEAARVRHKSATPVETGVRIRAPAPDRLFRREAIGSWVLGGSALVLALWGILQANETARMGLAAARLSVLPSLEFVVDADKQTLSLHNVGNGPAKIYYTRLTHRDWVIEQYRNSSIPADLQTFFPVVLSNLFNDPTFSPQTTTSGMTPVLDDGTSLALFAVGTGMTQAQKDKFADIPQHIKIELCYTNLLGDEAFQAGFGAGSTSERCPRPPKQGVVRYF